MGDEKTACEVYEELSSKNDEFLPKFIEVASRVNPSKGKAAAARLPSAEILTDNIDVEELEKKKSKRKRKPRLPKNLSKEIDPERWVPLRDRSYYRGRGKWKNKRTGKFTGDQGGLDKKTEAKFDYSNKATASPQTTQSSSSNKKKK